MNLFYGLAVMAFAVWCAFLAIQGSIWGIAGFLVAAAYLIEDAVDELRRAGSKAGWWLSRLAAAGALLVARRLTRGEWF